MASVGTSKTYRFLSQQSGSAYQELFVSGTSHRAQSLVSDLENESLTPEEIAALYRIPVEAVHEAIEYVHANEEYLASERKRARDQAIAKGYLESSE